MASKSSPQPPLTPKDFSGIMTAHRQWLDTGGQEGHQAEFMGADLQGLDLSSGYNLSGLDFREANLARVKFGDAQVEGANFKAADLREADLSKAQGLLAPQLAGADLAGARLPEGLQDYAALKHVDTASDDVQKLFLILLLVCVYCWLTIAVTTDANLLNNFAEQPLPIIGTKINLVMFYWAAPFLFICVYLYFHLCLQRLWEALAELPAVFPDGLPLPHRIHPWLWNGLVWAYFPRLRDRRPPLLRLQKFLAVLLLWWAGPLTILGLWFRYLPAHDWTITLLHLVFLILALDGALGFFLLTQATLRLKESKPFKGMALLTAVAIFALFFTLSLGSIEGLGGRPWVSANLWDADVSLKPPQWKPGDLELVRGANLFGRNLQGIKAERAFLVKANLQQANLQWADLQEADLQQANLFYANLQHADLWRADLQHANLVGTNLQHAKLEKADLREAKHLYKDQVRSARCWPLAKYSPEMLKSLGLPPEHNKNIENKNFSGYQLPEADLSGASLLDFNLRGANLQRANLEKAFMLGIDLTGADLRGANLKGIDFGKLRHGLIPQWLQSAIMDEKTQLPDDLKDLVPSGTKKP